MTKIQIQKPPRCCLALAMCAQKNIALSESSLRVPVARVLFVKELPAFGPT